MADAFIYDAVRTPRGKGKSSGKDKAKDKNNSKD